MKYRKKPVVIDAVQWDGSDYSGYPEGMECKHCQPAEEQEGKE